MHGPAYFADLVAEVRKLRAGYLLLFTDWRGAADERLEVTAASADPAKALRAYDARRDWPMIPNVHASASPYSGSSKADS